MFFECQVDTMEQALEKAHIFARKGVENTMVSLGEQGALLVCGGKAYIAEPPAVEAVSTIGAGDSAIAGFMAAAMAGGDEKERLKTAVAFGTAACLTEGTAPPRKEDIVEILQQIQLREIH